MKKERSHLSWSLEQGEQGFFLGPFKSHLTNCHCSGLKTWGLFLALLNVSGLVTALTHGVWGKVCLTMSWGQAFATCLAVGSQPPHASPPALRLLCSEDAQAAHAWMPYGGTAQVSQPSRPRRHTSGRRSYPGHHTPRSYRVPEKHETQLFAFPGAAVRNPTK